MRMEETSYKTRAHIQERTKSKWTIPGAIQTCPQAWTHTHTDTHTPTKIHTDTHARARAYYTKSAERTKYYIHAFTRTYKENWRDQVPHIAILFYTLNLCPFHYNILVACWHLHTHYAQNTNTQALLNFASSLFYVRSLINKQLHPAT